ncbi:MAG: phosphate ABC transporter permease PstA [Candidatus Rokubacteria bacterium]|nr:phosphate ABC transporter permease PstA [Candidatus Rokubacteria bacterium]
MVVILVAVILVNALGFFWPRAVMQATLRDGTVVAGQVVDREGAAGGPIVRVKLKVANRDLTSADFVWIDDSAITARAYPPEIVVVERTEWGPLIGVVKEVRERGAPVATGAAAAAALDARLPAAARLRRDVRAVETGAIGDVNRKQEQLRLALKGLEKRGASARADVEAAQRELAKLDEEYKAAESRLIELRSRGTAAVVVATAAGKDKEVPLAQVVGVYRPNAMSTPAKVWHYATRVWEFVSDDPRESNTEGGVFPAIFGTVMMVMIMSVIVAPLGVVAAFYLREYAKQGAMVSAVRIAVNNLAGVPSIVFGVFGVGFFIYAVGGTIDRWFYAESLPAPTFGTGGILWASLTLALLTIPVVIVATEEGLAAIPRSTREGSLALGATKFETTLRVVLPAVMPSVLTGLILAMARAAGEVAPLMLTGVVKLAPSLPLDGLPPFLHLERKFMHLGFHIYDVGFQSPNVDAARPMVFATTLLLLVIVVLLNLFAIQLRSRLRRRYRTTAL